MVVVDVQASKDGQNVTKGGPPANPIQEYSQVKVVGDQNVTMDPTASCIMDNSKVKVNQKLLFSHL